jgi:hypothetical protein
LDRGFTHNLSGVKEKAHIKLPIGCLSSRDNRVSFPSFLRQIAFREEPRPGTIESFSKIESNPLNYELKVNHCTYFDFDNDEPTGHPHSLQICLCNDVYWSADILNGLVFHRGDRPLPKELDTDKYVNALRRTEFKFESSAFRFLNSEF